MRFLILCLLSSQALANGPLLWGPSSKSQNLQDQICFPNGSCINGAGGAASWGSITGSIASQTDLQTALNAKEPSISAGTTAQYWRGDKTFQNFNTAAQGAVSATAPLVDTAGVFSIPQATSSVNGFLSSTDWSTFNNKEPAISSGTTAQYWRGDKTFQNFNAAAIAAIDLSGYAPLASPALTGVPTAPTAAPGTNTTQIATTAFVSNSSASEPMPVATSTSLVTTTSASTTFVNALTASITVTAASAPVRAACMLDMTSATAASVATVRVTINGVSGGSVTESLTTATTQHLTVPNQNLSASLAAGTYTVNCDFNRASGTGTVTIAQGSLTAVALQGTRALSGVVTLAGGGTNAALTAANGAIPYSTASALAFLAPGTTGQLLQSGGAGAPTWTAETFPASTTINQLLYSSAANVVSGLATVNTGALVTSSTGVPSITSGATANRVLRTNGTTVSFAQVAAATDISGTLPVANGGTGLTAAFAAGRVMFSNGTTLASDALFQYTTANTRFFVGQGGGTGRINGTVSTTDPTPNDLAGNFYSRATANSAVNIQNENTLPTLDMTNSGGTTVGANILAEASRGTLVARTQALSGDTLFSITAHGYDGGGYSTGFGATMKAVATENVTNATNGSDWVFLTTANGGTTPAEHLRVKQNGDVNLLNSHLTFSQTTSPTVAVQAAAGTGSTCTIASYSSDVSGQITIVTGTVGISTGSYCQITFNRAHATNPPPCVLTPASATLSSSVYFPSTTTTADVSFAIAGGISSTYVMNYFCPGSP